MPDKRDPNKVALGIYIDRDLREAANTKAKERGETVTDAVTKFLRRYTR